MASELETFLLNLAHLPAVLVTVEETRGSVPREAGAWMAVFADATRGEVGTIGGGHLEWKATQQAREALARWAAHPHAAPPAWRERVTLGPSLGQCCGGSLVLRFEPVSASHGDGLRTRLRSAHTPLALFGGGHVGRAIVRALEPLPFDVHWIDSRDGVFPEYLPAPVITEHSDPVHAAVRDVPAGSCVLIMSFSHAEDLDVVATCLLRQRARNDLAFIGLIGSRTKWATFGHRLIERGFSAEELGRVTCPIGLPGIESKVPAVIAASVVAQLLLVVGGNAATPKTA
ncbi:xanthine dehydrogenase accessory protein XdhC [Hydrogenophaga sp. PBL-H3]|uniref:xanthine dehydrogenase accessory protein XdhC n=1 Tax=Hydrogenophaga sp. PBL-H3 TaxID=434010 RepID=UPI00131F577C|nr:xanthine dehydrogenase accessory protein XdhC [Hydrogenophaga sp. PBL-H3]QHE75707.1 xanthine dehydrogenase accessory protein XdhC [Hydrogenophaga sp. PBL-H3]QHE80133.1 xanthine dehydrogenase accessory protein XdhC [Hydrogenophaga sp. PBL-H3]